MLCLPYYSVTQISSSTHATKKIHAKKPATKPVACATNLGFVSGSIASAKSAETSVTTNEDNISLNANIVAEISITNLSCLRNLTRKFFCSGFFARVQSRNSNRDYFDS